MNISITMNGRHLKKKLEMFCIHKLTSFEKKSYIMKNKTPAYISFYQMLLSYEQKKYNNMG